MKSILHRFLRLLVFKTGQPMHYLDHDYSPLLRTFNLSTIESTHAYHDHIQAFKIRNKLFASPEISALFASRDPSYELRRFNSLAENTHSSEYAYSASVPRLRRLWNMLPKNAQRNNSIGLFKGYPKKHLL